MNPLDLEKDIEAFYTSLERDKDYKRPVDYKERYLRVISRRYNPAHNNLNKVKGDLL